MPYNGVASSGCSAPAWVAAANTAVDWALASGEGKVFDSPMSLPKPHCTPFRQMLAHPAVLERLTWIFGSGFVHCKRAFPVDTPSILSVYPWITVAIQG